jgi:hypothetical protein
MENNELEHGPLLADFEKMTTKACINDPWTKGPGWPTTHPWDNPITYPGATRDTITLDQIIKANINVNDNKTITIKSLDRGYTIAYNNKVYAASDLTVLMQILNEVLGDNNENK